MAVLNAHIKHSGMKLTVFLLLMLPCISYAQHGLYTPTAPASGVGLHFEKMITHNNHVVDGKNKRTTMVTEHTEFLVPETVNKNEDNTFKAYGITIMDPHRILRANRMSYDCTTGKGTLHGYITLITDGVEKKMGRSARITLSPQAFTVN